jgi:hypothetical protein
MNSLAQFLTRRRGAPKHGSDEQPAMPANAAPSPDSPVSMPLAAPTFTPTALNLANTREFTVHGTHARTAPRHVQQDGSTLLRVRNALRDLPDAPLSRADRFAADMRSPRKGGLPVFRYVATRIGLGWCGLNEDYLPLAVPSPRGAERLKHWEHDCLHVIAAQVKTARIEISGTLAELDRYEARRRTAADAALALGYPGGTL